MKVIKNSTNSSVTWPFSVWQAGFMGFINRPSCNDRVQVRKRQAECLRMAYLHCFCLSNLSQHSNTLIQDDEDKSAIVMVMLIPNVSA